MQTLPTPPDILLQTCMLLIFTMKSKPVILLVHGLGLNTADAITTLQLVMNVSDSFACTVLIFLLGSSVLVLNSLQHL